jgi:nucleoside-diphosphate-sugar epimerase
MAAEVGVFAANTAAPVDSLTINLEICNNVLTACHEFGAKKTALLKAQASIHAKHPSPCEAPQPMRESSHMQGRVEPTMES